MKNKNKNTFTEQELLDLDPPVDLWEGIIYNIFNNVKERPVKEVYQLLKEDSGGNDILVSMMGNDLEICKKLIAAGADPKMKGWHYFEKLSAIDIATFNRNEDLVKYLNSQNKNEQIK